MFPFLQDFCLVPKSESGLHSLHILNCKSLHEASHDLSHDTSHDLLHVR